MYLLNAFSLNMLSGNADISVNHISLDTARNLAKIATSAVGHADTGAADQEFVAALDHVLCKAGPQ